MYIQNDTTCNTIKNLTQTHKHEGYVACTTTSSKGKDKTLRKVIT